MQTSTGDLGLVCIPGDHTDNRTPPGVDNRTADQESRSARDRSNWKLNPLVFQTLQQQMGTFTMILQLASRPRGRGDRCLHTELGSEQGICQSTMVPHQQVPAPSDTAASTDSVDNSLVDNAALVSIGMLVDYPLLLPNSPDLVTFPAGKQFG